jgi:hypothetical protein
MQVFSVDVKFRIIFYNTGNAFIQLNIFNYSSELIMLKLRLISFKTQYIEICKMVFIKSSGLQHTINPEAHTLS